MEKEGVRRDEGMRNEGQGGRAPHFSLFSPPFCPHLLFRILSISPDLTSKLAAASSRKDGVFVTPDSVLLSFVRFSACTLMGRMFFGSTDHLLRVSGDCIVGRSHKTAEPLRPFLSFNFKQ